MRTATTLAAAAAVLCAVSAHEDIHLRGHGCVEKRGEQASFMKEWARRRAESVADAASNLRFFKRQAGTAAGEGSVPAASGGASAAQYSCDASRCQLPNCHCASTSPPGNLAKSDVPMFITWTSDDAVQSYTTGVLDKVLGGRKNPNGCPVRSTYFSSLQYTNYSMITNYYVAGNEVADHTITHVPQPSIEEISGNLVSLNALAGIPFSSLGGFRAPQLNYTRQNLIDLHKMNFQYDSSSSSSVPVTDPNTDAFWPYTLDYGMANDCTSVDGICKGEPKLPGMWEIPMYAIFGAGGAADAHLMDPWLDAQNDPGRMLTAMQNTFMDHYNGNKQPFGLYSHPIHLSTDYPGVQPRTIQPMVDMINNFLNWAMASNERQNVWMVTNKQLLAWMRNPVPASQLNTLDEFKCQTPTVSQAVICNGMPDKENTVLNHCFSNTPGDPLNVSPFYTCYGCPETTPSPQQPNPPQKNNDNSVRTRISDKCDTPFWDPVAGKCLNSGFQDVTRDVGPNGASLSSTGDTNLAGDSSSSGSNGDGFTTFGGAGSSGATTLGSSFGAIVAAGLATAAFVALA